MSPLLHPPFFLPSFFSTVIFIIFLLSLNYKINRCLITYIFYHFSRWVWSVVCVSNKRLSNDFRWCSTTVFQSYLNLISFIFALWFFFFYYQVRFRSDMILFRERFIQWIRQWKGRRGGGQRRERKVGEKGCLGLLVRFKIPSRKIVTFFFILLT